MRPVSEHPSRDLLTARAGTTLDGSAGWRLSTQLEVLPETDAEVECAFPRDSTPENAAA